MALMHQKDWATNNNFVNAPYLLLGRVIATIQAKKAWTTVVAPWWPVQTWAQDLIKLSVRPPIPLPNSLRTFWSSGVRPEPMNNRKWRLFTWRLFGGKH